MSNEKTTESARAKHFAPQANRINGVAVDQNVIDFS